MKKAQFNYMYLKGLIISKYGSYKNFAQAIRKPASNVYNRLEGRIEFSAEDIYSWGKALELTATQHSLCFFTTL